MSAPQNFVSVSRRPPDVEDYIDIMRRYRSWIIGPTFAGLVISVVVAFWWPDMYACTAAMQIKPGSVPRDLIPSAVTGQMRDRLGQLQLEILGRDNLIAMIQDPKLDLYKKDRARYPVEDIAEDMVRKGHVRINMYSGGEEGRGAQAFRIFFEYPDRYKARAVVLDLVSQFQSRNAVLQTTQATSASTFLDDVVKTAKEKLEHTQADIATFQAQNQGKLPENFMANMMDVQAINGTIANINDQIGQEAQKQTLLEGSLNNNKNQQIQAEANQSQTQTTSNQTVKNSNLINIDTAINNKKMELDALLKRFQPDFPDVQVAKEQLRTLQDHKDQLEKEESSAGAGQPGSTVRVVPNPVAQQQLVNLRAEETNIRASMLASRQRVDILRKHGDELLRQLKDVQDKIAAGPATIQRFNTLQQDLEMEKKQYTDLSSKKDASETQQSMEEHKAGETLEILESPITPETPTSPVRPVIVIAGTVIGLVLGIVLAGAKEIKNTSLKNLKEVRAYTNLPVLSSIPLLENALLVRRKRRLAWLAWSSAIIIGSILMCGAVYYHLTAGAQIS
jgi:succinoglycan biosynthesis transport protein ExoP